MVVFLKKWEKEAKKSGVFHPGEERKEPKKGKEEKSSFFSSFPFFLNYQIARRRSYDVLSFTGLRCE